MVFLACRRDLSSRAVVEVTWGSGYAHDQSTATRRSRPQTFGARGAPNLALGLGVQGHRVPRGGRSHQGLDTTCIAASLWRWIDLFFGGRGPRSSRGAFPFSSAENLLIGTIVVSSGARRKKQASEEEMGDGGSAPPPPPLSVIRVYHQHRRFFTAMDRPLHRRKVLRDISGAFPFSSAENLLLGAIGDSDEARKKKLAVGQGARSKRARKRWEPGAQPPLPIYSKRRPTGTPHDRR